MCTSILSAIITSGGSSLFQPIEFVLLSKLHKYFRAFEMLGVNELEIMNEEVVSWLQWTSLNVVSQNNHAT